MITCPKCGGAGELPDKSDTYLVNCDMCNHSGRVTLLRWILAKIGVR